MPPIHILLYIIWLWAPLWIPVILLGIFCVASDEISRRRIHE